MQNFYNAYLADLKWFSQASTSKGYKSVADALRRHIKYLERGEKAKILCFGCKDLNEFLQTCTAETETRWDARIAGKFFFTLPNDMRSTEVLLFIQEVVSSVLQPTHYIAVLHYKTGDSGKLNTHVHIVFYPRDSSGRKLRIDRKKLRLLHKNYRLALNARGYKVIEHGKAVHKHSAKVAKTVEQKEVFANIAEDVFLSFLRR